MTEESIELLIGSPMADRVALSCSRRTLSGSCLVPTEIVVSGFAASLNACLDASDFRRFHEGLERLHRTLSGEAVLTGLEGELTIRLVGDGRGHIVVHGTAIEPNSRTAELRFEMSVDQSYLPEILKALATVAKFEQ